MSIPKKKNPYGKPETQYVGLGGTNASELLSILINMQLVLINMNSYTLLVLNRSIIAGVFRARTKQTSTRKTKYKIRVELTVVTFKMFPFVLSWSYPLSIGICGVQP